MKYTPQILTSQYFRLNKNLRDCTRLARCSSMKMKLTNCKLNKKTKLKLLEFLAQVLNKSQPQVFEFIIEDKYKGYQQYISNRTSKE
mgnify:FL=1